MSTGTLDLFGYTRAQMLTLTLKDIGVQPDQFDAFQRIIGKQDSVRDYEVNLRRKDGTIMECLLTATLRRGEDGEPIGYQGILRDITGRNRQSACLKNTAATWKIKWRNVLLNWIVPGRKPKPPMLQNQFSSPA
jgi:PAS domain S-box-containing protein